MPELPEVETIKRQLEKAIAGKTIVDIEVRNAKSFVGNKQEVISKKVTGVKRIGKMIHIEVEGQKDLLIHLKMSGQLLYSNKQQAISNKLETDKHVRVVFKFNDGSRLYFRDVRKFGWIKIVQSLKFKVQNLTVLGVEPFSDKFSVEYLKKVTKNWRRPVKILLMEQSKIAGIGNIYANEALFLAGIHPQRLANSLTEEEIKRLYNGILKALEEGIKHQGSSSRDRGYVMINGELGRHQDYFRVYQRDGDKCYKCGGIIERMVIGGRGTWVCRKCQK